MVRTPWGDAEELRARMLRPGGGVPPEEVAKSQRERLFAATVATVAEKGFQATSVADLVELSGVSRSDFYEHFANKEACFLASLGEMLEGVGETIAQNYDGEGSALRTFIELIVAQPAAAQVCFVEAYAAGPEARRMIAQAVANGEAVYEYAFAAAHQEGAPMPREIVQAIVGGLMNVIHTRLYRGEAGALPELSDQLRNWSLDYQAPPLPLRGTRHRQVAAQKFEGYNEVERICRATADVIAEKGYAETSTAEIAEHAHISLKTFYEHFANKEEAVVATLDASGALMLAVVGPAARRAEDWRHGVRETYEAMCSFLAAEPAFARLVTTEVYAAGPKALERRDRVIDSLKAMLAPGYEEHPETPAVAAEAIGGAIYALLRGQIHNGGPRSLPGIVPFATYLTIEPFVGPYEAAVIASDDRRRRKRAPSQGSPRARPAASSRPR